jgi:hypothetical protein
MGSKKTDMMNKEKGRKQIFESTKKKKKKKITMPTQIKVL